VWPNLPAEVLEKFADMNILLSAAFFRSIGFTTSKQAAPGAAPASTT
jgi:hypothetical protein